MPPVVKNLLIINGLMFLAAFSFSQTLGIDLWQALGLHYFESDKFEVYQIVTYMFMHGDLSHIFFNMFAVWMFGSAIENVWGSKRFLIYYLLTGFGAAFVHYFIITMDLLPVTLELNRIFANPTTDGIFSFAIEHDWRSHVNPLYYPSQFAMIENFTTNVVPQLQAFPNDTMMLEDSVLFLKSYYHLLVDSPNVVGASGSLFGILLAFGMMFPNAPIFMLFLPIPIKAKWLVMGYGAIELYSAFQNNPGDNVAHFAHLGGMFFGFLLIKVWQKSNRRWR